MMTRTATQESLEEDLLQATGDSHPAIKFLGRLCTEDKPRITVQLLPDGQYHKGQPYAKQLKCEFTNLSLADIKDLLPELHRLNERGAAVYVTRNEVEGHRSAASVQRVRGIHADCDKMTESQLERLKAKLLPTIWVNSSKGKYQGYWQLDAREAMTPDEAKWLNQNLAKLFGADKAAVDASRLLRLPGFRHMKYQQEGFTPIVTAEYSGFVYTAAQMREAFGTGGNGDLLKVAQTGYKQPNGVSDSVPSQVVESISGQVKSRFPVLWQGDWAKALRSDGTTGYPSASEADLALAGHIVRAARRALINETSLPKLVEDIFNRSELGASVKWQSRDDYRAATVKKAIGCLSTSIQSQATPYLLGSHGDIRNARAFASIASDKFIHVTTRGKWLRWVDERWMLCEKQEEQSLAKEVCRQLLESAQALFLNDQERGKRLVNEAMSAHRLNRIQAMLTLAISEPRMATTDKELDANPFFLGVENGVVDLRLGQLLFNQPEFRITRYCNASYDKNATCPRWQQFLCEIFELDIETINSVQRLLGCTLLGLANEEILVICYGHGSNGKSVFSNIVHKIMGGYSMTAPPSLLTTRKNGDAGPRNDLAALAGARYVSINELQAGDRLDEQIVKLLAGREPISARFLHQEFFEFEPTFTPWLRTNHKPIVTGDEDGIWRRLILLPFTKKFSGEEQDPHLEERLMAEKDGILMWILDGTSQYLSGGLKLSPRIKAEVNRYRSESDLLGEFLADLTTIDPTQKVCQSTLFSRYRYWCQDSGVRPSSKKSFTQRLAERGYAEGKSGVNRYYLGLSLRPTIGGTVVGRVDRINGDSDIFGTIKAHEEKTPKQETSCPTCPPTSVEVDHA